MKIASYNVMSGGFEQYDASLESPTRMHLIQEAVKTINSDVVGLVDTYRWDEIYSTDDLIQLFGYPFVACINLNDERLRKLGHNNGLTLLSKYKLVEVSAMKIATRDALSATVEGPNGKLAIVLLYLDDLSEEARLKQTEALLSQVQQMEPTVIIGDFNTFRTEDGTLERQALRSLKDENPQLLPKLNPIIADMAKGEVIKQFEKAGFKDGGVASLPTFPTQLFPAKLNEPSLRLDYVMASSRVEISNFRVPNDTLYHRASDHLPIVFDAKLS